MDKVIIVSGEHKGKTGVLTAMLWAAGFCRVKLEDGNEYDFMLKEVRKEHDI